MPHGHQMHGSGVGRGYAGGMVPLEECLRAAGQIEACMIKLRKCTPQVREQENFGRWRSQRGVRGEVL